MKAPRRRPNEATILIGALFLSGCAAFGDAEEMLIDGAGKYCELTQSDRLAIRKRFNIRIGKDGHCAVVQCEGDPPVSCPFLPSDASADPVFDAALTHVRQERQYLCAHVDVALTPQMSVLLMSMGSLQFFSQEAFSAFRKEYSVVMAGDGMVKTAMPQWYAVCVRQR